MKRFWSLLTVLALLMAACTGAAETVHTLADAGTRAQVQARLDDLRQEDTHYVMLDTLWAWLDAHVLQTEEGTALVMPSFKNIKRGDVPSYAGEQPSEFLPGWAQAMTEQFAALPEGETILLEGPEVDEALAAMLEDSNAWFEKMATDTRAYAALTRMTMDYMGDAAAWKGVAVRNGQGPRFSDEKERKTLKGNWSGGLVREAQEALIAGGFLGADGVTGQYDEATQEAVLAFEAANGRVEDGELDPMDLRVLYDEPLPRTLAQQLVAAESPMEDRQWQQDGLAGRWWNTALALLEDIGWQAGTLSYGDPVLEGRFDGQGLEDMLMERYLSGAVGYDALEAEVKTLASDFVQEAEADAPHGVVVNLNLEALGEGDFAGMYGDGTEALYDAFQNAMGKFQDILSALQA